jgi:hypothetical protein
MASVSRLERTMRLLRIWKFSQTLTRNSCLGPETVGIRFYNWTPNRDQIPHVDAFRRHFDTVLNESKLSREKINGEQEKDQFCKQLIPGSYSSKNEFFYDDTGFITGDRNMINTSCLYPYVKDVILENHDPVYASQPGMKRTCKLLALSFW